MAIYACAHACVITDVQRARQKTAEGCPARAHICITYTHTHTRTHTQRARVEELKAALPELEGTYERFAQADADIQQVCSRSLLPY